MLNCHDYSFEEIVSKIYSAELQLDIVNVTNFREGLFSQNFAKITTSIGGEITLSFTDVLFVCLFCCFTSQVNSCGHSERSVDLTTSFPGQAWTSS